ncbi:MAG: ABC transporter permease [candidate division Zixibacteria bacterium]|nr:ABC transporter permease [candidate division Zixibacteria bacterium]
MIVWEIFKMAVGALRVNKLRTSLTLLGIIIGVSSVITIISALEGLSQSIRAELNQLGPTTFIVTRFGLIMGHDAFMEALKRKPMKYEYLSDIEKGCKDCEKVAARSYIMGEVKFGNRKLKRVLIGGGTANIFDIVDLQLGQGRLHTLEEDQSRRRVAFVGATIAEELFPGLDPIGQTMKINNIRYEIIGMAKKKGATMGEDQDKFVFVPYSSFVRDFTDPHMDLDIFVKASSVERLPEAMDEVRVILRSVRHVPFEKEDDFGILTADAIMAAINDVTKYIRLGLIGISSIALIVGGIIIMNIMMVSVTERTREIGIRKSVGARQRNILLQFLFESLVLSLTGGIIGITIGVVLGDVLINLIKMQMTPSLFAIAIGLIISTGVGLFFGIYPAMKAARMQPVKALSFE